MKVAALTSAIVASVIGLASSAALADHNSIWGPGTANMPNDIHNTRIDTRLDDDNAAFIDFVRGGAGADSVNRYLDDDTSMGGGSSAMGGGMAQGGSRR